MGATPVGHDEFKFADGNAGHSCDMGSAPNAGELDVICSNSDTTISTPSGFTLATSRVSNQGAYLFYRFAVGGEASTFTVTTAGNFDAQASWSRWASALAFDVPALSHADASAGSSTPPVDTGPLGDAGELVIAFGAIHGATTSAPVWSAGYTARSAATQGAGAGASTGYVAYRTDAGTSAETPQVSWTTPAPDRYMLVATFTASSVPPFVPGDPMPIQGELNRIAGTFGLGEALAANIYAGTTDKMLSVQGALNAKNGTTGLGLQAVANALAGTTDLGICLALSKIPPA